MAYPYKKTKYAVELVTPDLHLSLDVESDEYNMQWVMLLENQVGTGWVRKTGNNPDWEITKEKLDAAGGPVNFVKALLVKLNEFMRRTWGPTAPVLLFEQVGQVLKDSVTLEVGADGIPAAKMK
jgi:hypothetical protein